MANQYLLLTILIFLNKFSFLLADDSKICHQKSPCICEFDDGTGIDLTPLSSKGFLSDHYFKPGGNDSFELSTYYYHPCTDIAFVLPPGPPNLLNTCNGLLGICRNRINITKIETNYTVSNGGYEAMGVSKTVQFSNDGTSLNYINAPSGTTIMLVCTTNGLDQLQVTSIDEPKNIILTLISPSACVKTLEEVSHRSLGSNLLIILFTLSIFYLVLGIGVRKFLMGATGLEVIPNLGFWTGLPSLVKEGWAFCLAGFKVPAQSGPGPRTPDPNSYDSI